MASIHKRPVQNAKPRWGAQVYLGRHPETGKHLFRSKTFATEREAKAWARDLEKQRDDGYRPASTKATYGAYLRDTWLPSYRTQVRSTYRIEKTLGKWLLKPRDGTPFLGGIALHKLTVAGFDRLYVAMAAQGIAARGIAHLHGLLKRALKAAVRKGELPRNPAEFATLPKPDVQAEITDDGDEEAAVVRALTQEQATTFLAAARQDRYSALWHVLVTGGLRPGEAFALKWRHVDFTHNVVQVRATLTRMGVEKPKAGDKTKLGWKLTAPKTTTSRRDVPLPEITIHEHVAGRSTRRRSGCGWDPSGRTTGSCLRRSSARRLATTRAGCGNG